MLWVSIRTRLELISSSTLALEITMKTMELIIDLLDLFSLGSAIIGIVYGSRVS